MSNTINHNNLILNSIPPCHTNNNMKLAKSIFPTPTPIIQQLIPSTSRSYNAISALFLTNLNKHLSAISPTIINSSAIKKTKTTIHYKNQKKCRQIKKTF